MNIAEMKDLAEELRSVSNSLSLLTCVIMEGIGDSHITPKCIGDNIFVACKHIERIADEMCMNTTSGQKGA